MFGIPLEILALPPLALAAGVDLYLTLLFIGAAPTTGLWDSPLPGALGDLDSPSVLIMVGTFYILEFAAERFPATALAWNAFHAIIRPLSGALLALLLLDGHPIPLVALGALGGGLLASIAHGVRSGSAVLRWLGAGIAPSVLLFSLAEDVLVLGIASLTLDAPAWAFGCAVIAALALAWEGPSLLRAFAYAVRLAVTHMFQTLGQSRWQGPEDMPAWVSDALEDDDQLAPGGALRGTRAGAWRLGGTRRFLTGWVVVRGGAPVFVHRKRRTTKSVDLGLLETSEVLDHDLFRRIDLAGDGFSAFLLFSSGGPSTEGLRAEFLGA